MNEFIHFDYKQYSFLLLTGVFHAIFDQTDGFVEFFIVDTDEQCGIALAKEAPR